MENDTPTLTNDTNQQPVNAAPPTEPSQPTSPAPQPDNAPEQPKRSKGILVWLGILVALVVGLGGGFGISALTDVGMKKSASDLPAPQVTLDKELSVPEGATVIAECAKGRGKQYVLPENIPQGPVYNVYNGKVIGVEYMLGQNDVLQNKDYLDLPLEGVKYDHINIGLLSKGHSGYPEPHYHVDVFTVSHEEAAKITCQ